MEVKVIDAVKTVLAPWRIDFCIVNEAALNYYNVPRALDVSHPELLISTNTMSSTLTVALMQSLEICVAERELSFAALQLASYTDVFLPYPWPDEGHRNIYADYKKPYPRFQAFMEGRHLSVVVFPDTFFHLDPLKDNIVQTSTYIYSANQIRFSPQFDYSTDTNALATVPVPRLASLLQGLAQRHVECNNDDYSSIAAMCAEQLVDGMNLSTTWCMDHLDATSDSQAKEGVQFVLRLVESKGLRISQFEPDNLTCFVATEEDDHALRMIPGYNELSGRRQRQIQAKRNHHYPWRTLLQFGSNWLKMGLFWAMRRTFHPVVFQYMSDLHLEVGSLYTSFVVPKAAPYLVLAGDIGCLRDYAGLLAFLTVQCAQFDRVFLVLGNHEFYGISREDGLQAAKSLETEPQLLGKLSILNRNRVDINRRVTILGCTLHSYIPKESQLWVRMKVADFSSIRDWTVEKHNIEHLCDVEWLQGQLRNISLEDPDRQLLVVTHHAPSFSNTVDPKHTANPWQSAFCTDLLDSGQVKFWHGSKSIRRWIFGHTHWNTEFKKHGMVVSSNQRGYLIPGHEPPIPKPRVWTSFLGYFFLRFRQDFLVAKLAQV